MSVKVVNEIIKQTCEAVGVAEWELLANGREQQVICARQIITFLAREITGWTFQEIATRMSKCHSTAFAQYRSAKAAIESRRIVRIHYTRTIRFDALVGLVRNKVRDALPPIAFLGLKKEYVHKPSLNRSGETRTPKTAWTVENLIDGVCEMLDVSYAEIYGDQKRSEAVIARDTIYAACINVRDFGIEVPAALLGMSPNSIKAIRKRIKGRLERDDSFMVNGEKRRIVDLVKEARRRARDIARESLLMCPV